MQLVESMKLRGQEIGRRLASSEEVLAKLNSSHGYDEEYFSNQWERQKKLQLSAISQKAADQHKKLGVLLKLEEELLETRCVLVYLFIVTSTLTQDYSNSDTIQKLELKRVKRRKHREQQELLNLPKTLALLEEKIQDLAAELGSQEFMELTGVSGKGFFSCTLLSANIRLHAD